MKNLKYIIATLFVVAVGAGIFWACEKDIDKSDALQNGKLVGTKNHKSMGNHQQPTSDININTDINIMNVVYTVVGSAEVGDYDGRIYAYDAMWTIHIAEMNEDFTLHLTATLKPEYEDLMMVVDPFIENYIIAVNGINVGPDFILTVDTTEIITYASVSEFWTNIIIECNENMAVNATIRVYYEGQVHSYLCEGLISFKESLEPYYSLSTSYEDFIDLLEVDEQATSQLGNNLLLLAYDCLLNGYSNQYIYEHYTGKYMADVALYFIDNPGSDGSELFNTTSAGGNYPCKWWQLGCHLNQFIAWVNSPPVQKFFETVKGILADIALLISIFK